MKHICFLFFVFVTISASAQSSFDQRLLSKFSAERVAELQNTNPEIVAYWEFYLDNSFEIVELPPEKALRTDQSLKIKDLNDINILDHNLTMLRSTPQYFRIKGSEKILVLYSNDAFAAKFNKFRDQK